MTVYLLNNVPVFPHPSEADETGLLAIGGDLSTERLISAYISGIFPWFMEDEEIYWFSPDPRMVMFPKKYHLSDSQRRVEKSGKFTVKFDTRFEEVIRACGSVFRSDQDGTWINDSFIEAYCQMHKLKLAHSVETYESGELVGGLYGISIGKAFFGESMFYKTPNASKIAFSALIRFALKQGFKFIDCQAETKHLLNAGASLIRRELFLKMLENALNSDTLLNSWDRYIP